MRAKKTINEPLELNDLRELSALIGGNPLLVQASSGNTSMKIDDVLWIKGSGKWLVHAYADDFLIPVKLAKARSCLDEGRAIPETALQSAAGPCASIETAMHALLPQKVVVHVHSVNTIAWAVREDGPRQLSRRLAGLNWQWIPYAPSGFAIAKRIQQALSYLPETNILVLGNHGLVVCGDNCPAVLALLSDVEERLAVEPRTAPASRPALLDRMLSSSGWSLPPSPSVHALATDPSSRQILAGGVLYPCQIIFLPETTPSLTASRRGELSCDQLHSTRQNVLLIEDQGVLCSRHMTGADQEMLVGLVDVIQRIDASAPIRYLSRSEVMDVLNAGGQNYRLVSDTNAHPKVLTPSV